MLQMEGDSLIGQKERNCIPYHILKETEAVSASLLSTIKVQKVPIPSNTTSTFSTGSIKPVDKYTS